MKKISILGYPELKVIVLLQNLSLYETQQSKLMSQFPKNLLQTYRSGQYRCTSKVFERILKPIPLLKNNFPKNLFILMALDILETFRREIA